MKKVISIILTLTMFLSVIYPCESVIAEEISKENALAIGNEIAQMCAEYDDYSELDASDDKTIDTRLIVKSDNTIDEYGAIDSVYGFGYAFLQYADEKSAKYAMEKYLSLGYMAEYDSVATSQIIDDDGDDFDPVNSDADWAYKEVDSPAVIDYYKYRIKSDIYIAVIDSGIDYTHSAFKNRVVRTNVNFSSDPVQNEYDYFGHGTMVAGVIARSTPDNVKIQAYKTGDSTGYGTTSNIISAVSYISELTKKPDIINFSLSVGTNEILEQEINDLINEGVTVVAAAGNDNKEIIMTPERMENVIAVSATNMQNNPTVFSNYGTEVDIAAPGKYVYTALTGGGYKVVNGTSFSAPLVASAAAIVLMENKDYTPEQVKQELIATAIPFKKSDCYNGLYGVGIVNFSNLINGTRCKDITTNYQSGVYREDIRVELKCANSLVDIYYTTDGSLPIKENSIKYDGPIDVTESTRIIATAFPKVGSTLHSKYLSLDYYILKNNEPEYMIDNDGTILSYLGGDTDLVVPDTINGIVPTAVDKKLFYYYKDIKSIVLPDSVTLIGQNAFRGTNLEKIVANGAQELGKYCFEGTKLQNADFPNAVKEYYAFNNTPIVSASLPNLDYAESGFYNCSQLSSVYIPNLRAMDYEVFYGCSSLTQELKLPKLEGLGYKAFANSYFKSIILPMCSNVTKTYAFENCAAETILLGNASTYPDYTFYQCTNLKNLYLPKIKGIGVNTVLGCNNIEFIFAPKLESFTTCIPHDVTVYCSDRFVNFYYREELSNYNYTFVCPEITPALSYLNGKKYENLYTRINSDELANSKGAQIRTRDNGLRFGFEFDKNDIGFDCETYAQNIEYGFVYIFDDISNMQSNEYLRADKTNVFVKSADKINVNGTLSTYNAVFTGIPASHYDDKISVRAYACVDGMYFYSPVTIRSFGDVASQIIADDEIDQNTKDEVNRLLEKEV